MTVLFMAVKLPPNIYKYYSEGYFSPSCTTNRTFHVLEEDYVQINHFRINYFILCFNTYMYENFIWICWFNWL